MENKYTGKVKKMMKDESFRKALKTAILEDKEFVTDIAKEIFAINVKEVGGTYPGTISDFFRQDW